MDKGHVDDMVRKELSVPKKVPKSLSSSLDDLLKKDTRRKTKMVSKYAALSRRN